MHKSAILSVFCRFYCRRGFNNCTLLTRQSTSVIKDGCGVCVECV